MQWWRRLIDGGLTFGLGEMVVVCVIAMAIAVFAAATAASG